MLSIFSTIVFGAGVLVLIASIIAFFKVKDRYGDRKKSNWVLPVTGVVIFAIFGVSTTLVTVDPRKDGVVTSFKKPTGEVLESGASWVKPWESVHEMDAANQTKTYQVGVQMAGGAFATVTVYPSWKIGDNAASDLYQEYKSFDNVVASLWEQQLQSTANNVFGSYNPLTNVDPLTGELKKTKVEWAAELKAQLESNVLLKGKISINSLSIPTIAPDKETQDKLNQIVAEFAKGSVLEQQKINADKEKEIADKQVQIKDQLFCMRENSKNGLDAGTCLGGNSIIVDSRKK